jgi:hypothetical protein
MTPETIPVDKALWEQMETLAKAATSLPVNSFMGREARAIVDRLPKEPTPVDPLVLRAREICAETSVFDNQATWFREGHADDDLTMRAVLAALREKEAG